MYTKKRNLQKIIIVLSCLANLAVHYDFEICIKIQAGSHSSVDIGENLNKSLPDLQFIRLTTAISVLMLGLTLEQMCDLTAKRVIVGIMTIVIGVKLIVEINLFNNPLVVGQDDNINQITKIGKAVLLSLIKILQVI